MLNDSFPHDAFSEELAANGEYIKSFKYSGLTGVAQKGLAIVTCMDSRINPLSIMGMKSGDAKILRNAGARVTEDVLRTLVLATYLLGVKKILVMPHTNCRMASAEEVDIHNHIQNEFGVDTRSLEFRTVKDQEAALAIVPGTSHILPKEKPGLVNLIITEFLEDLTYPVTRMPIRRTNPVSNQPE